MYMDIRKMLALLLVYAEEEAAENELLDLLKTRAENVKAIRYDKNNASAVQIDDKIEQDVIKLVETQKRFARLRKDRTTLRIKALHIFSENLSPAQALVMALSYVLGWSMKQVEEFTGYSQSACYNLRLSAEKKLKKGIVE